MNASKRIIALSLIISLVAGNMFGAMAADAASPEAKAAADLASFTVGTIKELTTDTTSQSFGQVAPAAECKIIQRVAIEPGICRTQAEQTAIEAELAAQAKKDADAIVASIKESQKTAAAEAVKAAAASVTAQKAADTATKAAELANKTLLATVASYNNASCGTSKPSTAKACATLQITLDKNIAAKETADNAKDTKAQEAVTAQAKLEIFKNVASDAATNLTAATKAAETAAQLVKDTAAKVAVDVAQAKKDALAQAATEKLAKTVAASSVQVVAKAAVPMTKADKEKLFAVTAATGEMVAGKVVSDYMNNVQASIDNGTAPDWALIDDSTKASYYVSEKVRADGLGIKAYNDSVADVKKQLGLKFTSEFETILKNDTAAATLSLKAQNKIRLEGLKEQAFLEKRINVQGDPRIQQTIDAAKKIAEADKVTDLAGVLNATFEGLNQIYGGFNTEMRALSDKEEALEEKVAAVLNNSKLDYKQKFDQAYALYDQIEKLQIQKHDIGKNVPNNTVEDCYGETVCRQRTAIAQTVLKLGFGLDTVAFGIPKEKGNGIAGHVLLRIPGPTILGFGKLPDTFIDPSNNTVTVGGTYETAFTKLIGKKITTPAAVKNDGLDFTLQLPKITLKLPILLPTLGKLASPLTIPDIGGIPGSGLGSLGSLGSIGSFNLAGIGTLTKPTQSVPLPRLDWGGGDTGFHFDWNDGTEYKWDNGLGSGVVFVLP